MTGEGTIPADWEVTTLDEVSVKIQDGTHFSPTLGGSEYRYITSRNIGNGRLRLDAVEMISESEHRKIYRRCDTRFGDLLLTKDGANTGNAALNSFTDEISLLSSVAFIRANHRYATENYLLQYLLSQPGRKQIEDAMAGNAITRLTLAKIKALRVPLPPLAEQQRIAVSLSDTDDLISALDSLIAKKQAIKQGMLQQLMSGHVRLADKGEVNPRRLAEVSLKIQDGTHFSPALGGSDYRYITSRNIGFGEMRLDHVEMISGAEHRKIYGRCDTKLGDLLLTKDGANTGNAALNPFPEEISLLSSVAFIRCDRRQAIEAYILQYFLTSHGQRQMKDAMAGNAITRLTLAKIRNLVVPLPSIEEQHSVAGALGDADHEIAMLRLRLQKARAIKTGMMQQLLTGRTRLPMESNS